MERAVYEYISKQTGDPIIEWRTCTISGESFAIFQSDVGMLDALSPIIGGKKYALPLPTITPYERNRRRIAFRNDSKIYRRKCDFSWKEFISTMSQDKPYKVYHQNIWYSDVWDPFEYGQDFDENKDFFQQFNELLLKVPRLWMQLKSSENCDYSCVISNGKNCYLANVCSWSEDVLYSSWVVHSRSCMDCFRSYKLENSYQAIQCNKSFKLKYCFWVNNSSDCTFSVNLDSCSSCFLCNNLSNQEYCIRNKKYSKEEYQALMKEIDRCDQKWFEKANKEYIEILEKKAVYQTNWNINSQEVYWAFLTECKNCVICFDVVTWEDCRYFFDAGSKEKTCMDCSYGWDIEKSYETLSSGTIWYGNLFSSFCRDSNRLMYCDICMGCSDCFGCVSLKNKEYCIFNKQYTKAEYEVLVDQIIMHMHKTGEWWNFFPMSISTFGYNETVAMDSYPLTCEEAQWHGYNWMDKEFYINVPEKYQKLVIKDLPQDIKDVQDDILDKVIVCKETWKPFRLVKAELEFYRKHSLPLPHKHPDQRHKERLKRRIPRDLHLRICDKCNIETLSVYTSNSEFKVYCESCYNREIYW